MQNGDLDVLEPDELTALAQLDMEANRLDQALGKLKRAVEHGAPGEALAMLGRLYARLGLFERAKEALARYLQAHPHALVSRFQYAMVCLDMGDATTGFQVLEQILDQEPGHPPALFHKALVLAESGRSGEALSVLDVLLTSAEPDNLFHGRGLELKTELEGIPSSIGATPDPRRSH